MYPRKKKDKKEKKLRKTKNFKRAADLNSQPLESRADWQIPCTTTGPRAQVITLIFSLIPPRAQKTRVFAKLSFSLDRSRRPMIKCCPWPTVTPLKWLCFLFLELYPCWKVSSKV